MSYATPALDSLHIHTEDSITLQTIVGVYEWERLRERPLIFDLRLESMQPLNLDRMQIKIEIEEWLVSCRFRLLEALAEHLCARMLAEWQCSRVVLGIEKPGALGDIARVGIRIHRSG